jgi:predicted nucleotidyltransferase
LEEGTVLRKPKDRDFIRTKENFIFCVVGYLHPADRLLAYLKYVPGEGGPWASGDLHFKRVMPFYSAKSVLDTYSFLKKNHQKYLFNDPVNRMTFPAVAQCDIEEYYEPEKKLMDLGKGKGAIDALESEAINLAEYLSGKAGVPIDKFGVTGSILLGIHNVSVSDIDLTIYGYKNALQVKQTLTREYKDPSGPLRQLTPALGDEWCSRKAKEFSIDPKAAALILKKKWNFGYYHERLFSIHPIKMDSEISENYGDREFKSEGPIEMDVRVDNAAGAIFNPAVYKVGESLTWEGAKVKTIEEVVSYEGIFSDIAYPDQFIRVRGNLETVTNRATKEKYHRVVVGSGSSKTPEYIIPPA